MTTGQAMIPHPQIDRDPEAMTTRARVVLVLAFARNLAIGSVVLAFPDLFHSPAWFDVSKFGVGLIGWGLVLCAVAAVCGVSAVYRHAPTARVALAMSGVVAAMISAGVTSSWIDSLGGEAPFSPAIPILLISLTGYDFVMCAQPIRTPLERILHRMRNIAAHPGR